MKPGIYQVNYNFYYLTPEAYGTGSRDWDEKFFEEGAIIQLRRIEQTGRNLTFHIIFNNINYIMPNMAPALFSDFKLVPINLSKIWRSF